MSEIVAIGQKEQIIGFQGVGVRTRPVKNQEEFAAALAETVRKRDVEIVLVPETFAEEGAGAIRAARKKSQKVILVIPDHHGSRGLAITEMKEDVEQALGVDMISKGA